MSRRMLSLLCHLSREPAFAKAFGGASAGNAKNDCCTHLATMILHFIDKLTASDGGTHPDIDIRKTRMPTSTLAIGNNNVSPAEKERAEEELLQARGFSRFELGLDVANLSHQFLALVS